MARESGRRANPRLLMPTAKSIISVALNYYTAPQHEADTAKGKISRYAWGDDYHGILNEKLNALLDWIRKEWPGTHGKVCVDVQPMMDKAWAARAGLGWIGKHARLWLVGFSWRAIA
jgi:epoxyqueuosine reductase